LEIANNLLQAGIAIEIISKTTGLTLEEVNQITTSKD
jgi:predicted transposase YdaD